VKKWHGAGDTIARDTTRTMWYMKPGKDECSVIDAGRAQNEKIAYGTEV
jgi:hypothetical protein